MRVTSHCANHPSKEARQRCSNCRTWLCEACFHRFGTHVYCGRRCHLQAVAKNVVRSGLQLAGRRLHPGWVIAVSASVAALLLTAVGLHLAELISVSQLPNTPETPTSRPPEVAADVFHSERGTEIRIAGTPGTRIVLLDDGIPLGVVTIGSDGTVEAPVPDSVGDTNRVDLAVLSDSTIELDWTGLPPDRETPTPSRTGDRTASRPPQADSVTEAAGPSPPILQLVKDAGPRIALTYDGNSSSNGTGELLDLLHKLDLDVTIFVTGRFIERYPGVVRRAVLSGHEVGNHTYSHLHLTTYEQNRRHDLKTGITRERFQNELRKTEMAFRKATGRAMAPLWRAPYGEENRTLRAWALELGYLHIRWSSLEGASLDSRDWVADEHSSMYQNSSTMMERLLRFPELRGGIVLMHLATSRDEPPWVELPTFVESLRERGLSPTTVSGLLEESGTWRPWLRRARERHIETFGR